MCQSPLDNTSTQSQSTSLLKRLECRKRRRSPILGHKNSVEHISWVVFQDYSLPKSRTICSDHFVTGKYNVMALARSVFEIRWLFIVGNSTVLTEVSSCTSRRPTKQGSSSPGLRPFNISSQGSKQCEGKKKP